jgi:hypothetical protein
MDACAKPHAIVVLLQAVVGHDPVFLRSKWSHSASHAHNKHLRFHADQTPASHSHVGNARAVGGAPKKKRAHVLESYPMARWIPL